MTNDLPDALIEKVARALCEAAGVIPDAKVSIGQDSWETFIPEAAKVCEALDISGIINDLRFYGGAKITGVRDATKFITGEYQFVWEESKGQRARTRLLKLEGESE